MLTWRCDNDAMKFEAYVGKLKFAEVVAVTSADPWMWDVTFFDEDEPYTMPDFNEAQLLVSTEAAIRPIE